MFGQNMIHREKEREWFARSCQPDMDLKISLRTAGD
jgi:hypothetical protein